MKKIFIFAFLFIIIFSSCGNEEIWKINEKEFRKKIINEEEGEIIYISEYTPFKWDKMYIFAQYPGEYFVTELIGEDFNNVYENGNDIYNQIIFVKDGKIVYYRYGYPENYGYDFTVPLNDENAYIVIDDNENAEFIIQKEEKYLCLKYVD